MVSSTNPLGRTLFGNTVHVHSAPRIPTWWTPLARSCTTVVWTGVYDWKTVQTCPTICTIWEKSDLDGSKPGSLTACLTSLDTTALTLAVHKNHNRRIKKKGRLDAAAGDSFIWAEWHFHIKTKNKEWPWRILLVDVLCYSLPINS